MHAAFYYITRSYDYVARSMATTDARSGPFSQFLSAAAYFMYSTLAIMVICVVGYGGGWLLVKTYFTFIASLSNARRVIGRQGY